MGKIILTYLFLLLFAFGAIAQQKTLVNADALFVERDYVGAISLYKKALRKTDDFNKQQQIAHSIAMSYFNMNDYYNSSQWFEDAIGDKSNNIESYIYYSQSLAVENKFTEAKNILEKAKIQDPKNIEIDNRISAIDLILDNKEADTLDIVYLLPVVNSEYSDYSIGSWKNGIVFSSTRKEKINQRTDGRTGYGFSDLFFTEFDYQKQKWTDPEKMPNKFNTLFNDGAFTFDAVNNIAYWTTCTEKPGSCLIYSSEFLPQTQKWTKPSKVSFMNPKFSYGHPNISEDGNTMYFTSNMPGGYGKNDIWKITMKTGGIWGIPVNLGEKINTPKNDMFPSVYGDTLLFYSSDGLNTYGGLDIHFSVKRGLEFLTPVNIGLPINSAADDFSLLISDFDDGGYFCSNRNIETSDDIYGFDGFPIKIVMEGKIRHDIDSLPISEAMVIITNEEDVADTIMSNFDGYYSISLDAYQKYRVSVFKAKYYKEEKIITTNSDLIFAQDLHVELDFYLSKKSYTCGIKGVVTNKETHETMYDVKVEISNDAGFSTYVSTGVDGVYIFSGLKPKTNYTVKTGKAGYFSESRVCILPKVNETVIFSKTNGYDMDFQLLQIQTKKEITLNNIYYDFNKATLRQTSIFELNKLASMMRETPNVVIQINSHTDSRGTNAYNLKLSADRANSVVNYLISEGVDRDRLVAKGYGESMLLIKYAINEDDHQANRRTTFSVIDENNKLSYSTEEIKNSNIIYRVQILSTGKIMDLQTGFRKVKNNINDVDVFQIDAGNIYKYEVGNRNTFSDVAKLKKTLRKLGYYDCFVVSYLNNNKIPVSQAREMEGGANYE